MKAIVSNAVLSIVITWTGIQSWWEIQSPSSKPVVKNVGTTLMMHLTIDLSRSVQAYKLITLE